MSGRIAYRLFEAQAPTIKPDVVLLHGLGSCSEDWGFQVPVLTRSHRVLALDLPGHGQSPALPQLPTIDNFASVVIEALGPVLHGPAHFVGLSLGGLVALQSAIDYPERVASLTIVNAFARMQVPGRGLGRMLGRMGLLLLAPMAWVGRWVADGLFPDPEQDQLRTLAAARLAANPRRAYLQAAMAVARFDASGKLGCISCPALIIAGEQDQTVGYQAKRRLADGIRGARFVSLPGSGHASPVDAYSAFNQALLDFLSDVELASSALPV
jgi:3-oxoadipate enol-lactonase